MFVNYVFIVLCSFLPLFDSRVSLCYSPPLSLSLTPGFLFQETKETKITAKEKNRQIINQIMLARQRLFLGGHIGVKHPLIDIDDVWEFWARVLRPKVAKGRKNKIYFI
jgi:hypothetical protein